MNKNISEKIQVLMEKAKEGKTSLNQESQKVHSNIPNSLADHIKTEEQAKTFMTLLRAL